MRGFSTMGLVSSIKIIQLCAGLAAITALVAAEALGVALSAMAIGMLSFVAGWVLKRPADMLTTKQDG